jgi:hypothetical protein
VSCSVRFDAPLTRRFSAIVPFLPFSRHEALVIADQCFRQSAMDLFAFAKDEHKLGRVKLFWSEPCVYWFRDKYSAALGAPSISGEITRVALNPISTRFGKALLKSVKAGKEAKSSGPGTNLPWLTLSPPHSPEEHRAFVALTVDGKSVKVHFDSEPALPLSSFKVTASAPTAATAAAASAGAGSGSGSGSGSAAAHDSDDDVELDW